MLKFVLGVGIGGLAAWLYASEAMRGAARQQLIDAPAPLRQGVASAAASTASGADRIARAVDAAPLPSQIKQGAQAVTAAAKSLAENVQQPQTSAAPTAARITPEIHTSTPEEVLVEQDAATRAAAEAQRQIQAGE